MESSSKKKKKRKNMELDPDDDIEGATGIRNRFKKGKSDFKKKNFGKGKKKKLL